MAKGGFVPLKGLLRLLELPSVNVKVRGKPLPNPPRIHTGGFAQRWSEQYRRSDTYHSRCGDGMGYILEEHFVTL